MPIEVSYVKTPKEIKEQYDGYGNYCFALNMTDQKKETTYRFYVHDDAALRLSSDILNMRKQLKKE